MSGVLQKVIDNGGAVSAPASKGGKLSFALPLDKRDQFRFADRNVTASVIARQINEMVDLEVMQKLKTTSITAFLLQAGLFEEYELPSGQKAKRPTDAGRGLGIRTEQHTGQPGNYTVVVYDRSPFFGG